MNTKTATHDRLYVVSQALSSFNEMTEFETVMDRLLTPPVIDHINSDPRSDEVLDMIIQSSKDSSDIKSKLSFFIEKGLQVKESWADSLSENGGPGMEWAKKEEARRSKRIMEAQTPAIAPKSTSPGRRI